MSIELKRNKDGSVEGVTTMEDIMLEMEDTSSKPKEKPMPKTIKGFIERLIEYEKEHDGKHIAELEKKLKEIETAE